MRFDAARPARADPLLRYSLAELAELIFAGFEAAGVRSVVEIGAEGGEFTQRVVEWVTARDGRLVSIDPNPNGLVRKLAAGNDAVSLRQEMSHRVLPELEACDAYLLDGDHNYFTVSGELAAIHATAAEAGTHPLLILQDVAWPAGRRDQYYDPESIPADARHPYDYGGVLPWEDETQPARGFRGEGAFAFATHEGGPDNGVCQALEDFLASHDGLDVISIPCIFGLAVVFPKSAPWARKLRSRLSPFDDHPLLARLESNRVRLYLAVLELQDRLDRERRRAAEVEAALRAEAQTLRAELGIARQELREAAAARGATVAELYSPAPSPAGASGLLSGVGGFLRRGR